MGRRAAGLRIVGGHLARRRIAVPPGSRVRPTSDRVRESLFGAVGEVWQGRVVLDLFAGSGCLGIESLSRGAVHATFVERDGVVRTVLRQNLASLGLVGESRVIPRDARAALRSLGREGARFDAVWLDPPYRRSELVQEALDGLSRGGLLAPGALVLVEHPTERPPRGGENLVSVLERSYGATGVTVYERRT